MEHWEFLRLLFNFNEEHYNGVVISPSSPSHSSVLNKWYFLFKTFSMILLNSLKMKKEKLPDSKWVNPCTWTLHLPRPKTWIKFVTPLSGLYPNKTIMSFPTTVAVCPVTPTGLSTPFLKRVHCLNDMLNVHVSLETTPFLQVPPNRIKQFWNQQHRLKLTASNILNCYNRSPIWTVSNGSFQTYTYNGKFNKCNYMYIVAW